MNRLFQYFNQMPWAKPLTMLVVINGLLMCWVILITNCIKGSMDISPVFRDIYLGLAGFTISGNYTKSYLEHKLDSKTQHPEPPNDDGPDCGDVPPVK